MNGLQAEFFLGSCARNSSLRKIHIPDMVEEIWLALVDAVVSCILDLVSHRIWGAWIATLLTSQCLSASRHHKRRLFGLANLSAIFEFVYQLWSNGQWNEQTSILALFRPFCVLPCSPRDNTNRVFDLWSQCFLIPCIRGSKKVGESQVVALLVGFVIDVSAKIIFFCVLGFIMRCFICLSWRRFVARALMRFLRSYSRPPCHTCVIIPLWVPWVTTQHHGTTIFVLFSSIETARYYQVVMLSLEVAELSIPCSSWSGFGYQARPLDLLWRNGIECFKFLKASYWKGVILSGIKNLTACSEIR